MEQTNNGAKIAHTNVSGYYAALQKTYGNLPASGVYSAFSRTSFGASYTKNPYIQNSRVKSISSRAIGWDKDKIAEMLKAPQDNETPLRETMRWSQFSAYPLFNLRKTYQDVLTYRWYNYPSFLDEEQAKSKEFLREWRLLEKICKELNPAEKAHQINGQCSISGKVHMYLRKKIDKAHNSCDYIFMQQLPSDWCKIVGFNNVSKYTIMFNMMYFLQPGTDWRQFGDLFTDYVYEMAGFIESRPRYDNPKNTVFASFDLQKFNAEKRRGNIKGNPDVYEINGTWFYWVTLPVEDVWTFEIDDVAVEEVSPFTGLLMSAVQQADYEAVQLSILQNPLVSLVLAEMDTIDTDEPSIADPIKISPATREAYETLWYSMLSQNNTSGIGFFSAPFKDMHLEQLAEAPNAADISSKGYKYLIQKSGIGIISTSDEPRVGLVNIAAQLAAEFPRMIYAQFERMMNRVYSELNLKYDWSFKMFGDIFSEKDDLKAAKDGMTLGLLVETLRYDAIRGHSLLDDLAISNAVSACGVLDKRLPLISTYSAKSGEAGLPPSGEPGRPENDAPQSEGNEDAKDAPSSEELD